MPEQPAMKPGVVDRWGCADNEYWVCRSMQDRFVHTCEVCGEGIFYYGWKKVRETASGEWVVGERHAKCLMKR